MALEHATKQIHDSDARGVSARLPEQSKVTIRENAGSIVGIEMVAAPEIAGAEFGLKSTSGAGKPTNWSNRAPCS